MQQREMVIVYGLDRYAAVQSLVNFMLVMYYPFQLVLYIWENN